MKVINRTGLRKIDEAIDLFHTELLTLVDRLSTLDPNGHAFTYTDHTNGYVLSTILQGSVNSAEIFIELYYSKNPWSAAIGYSDGSNKVYVNGRKINTFSAKDYAGTIAHEWMHILGYGHGNNYPSPEKDMSVPYAIGYLVSGESDYPFNQKEPVKQEMYCYRPAKYLWLKKVCYVK